MFWHVMNENENFLWNNFFSAPTEKMLTQHCHFIQFSSTEKEVILFSLHHIFFARVPSHFQQYLIRITHAHALQSRNVMLNFNYFVCHNSLTFEHNGVFNGSDVLFWWWTIKICHTIYAFWSQVFVSVQRRVKNI